VPARCQGGPTATPLRALIVEDSEEYALADRRVAARRGAGIDHDDAERSAAPARVPCAEPNTATTLPEAKSPETRTR
jgi:hypothetical protein